jgi:hypothetical protein
LEDVLKKHASGAGRLILAVTNLLAANAVVPVI